METLPKKLASEPIKFPGSPFWLVFKRFGRDEMIAMLINIIGTAIAGIATSNPIFLAVAGPIFEKIGFFPAHFWEARKVYNTTPVERRKSQKFYFWMAVKGGGVSLAEDIIIHDPIYIVLMYMGLTIYPGMPVWILAALSFAIAVVVVAFIEVGFTEIRFKIYKWKLRKIGFENENYFESRFYISGKEDPTKVIEKLVETFGLIHKAKLKYNDVYLDSKISHYSGRLPKLRLRMRSPYEISQYSKHEVVEYEGFLQTAQIVFTRASELGDDYDQWRYFPLKKEKFYYFLDQDMPNRVRDIEDSVVKDCLTKIRDRDEPIKEISFYRTLAQNAQLLVSIDDMNGRPFYLLELKSYDANILITAMRYTMMEFTVVQTTHGKHEIVE